MTRHDRRDGTGSALARHLAKGYRADCHTAAAAGSLTWRDELIADAWAVCAETDPARIAERLDRLKKTAGEWSENLAKRA